MNEQDFKARARRLHEVNDVISNLEQSIRSEAFALLEGYVIGEDPGTSPGPGGAKSPRVARRGGSDQESNDREGLLTDDEDALVETHISDSDSDNALLALALFYKRHGRGPFEMSHLKAIAKEHNLNIPTRPDVFLKGAKRGDPKTNVLRKLADGWKIMPSGEKWLKDTYGVAKGRGAAPAPGDDES